MKMLCRWLQYVVNFAARRRHDGCHLLERQRMLRTVRVTNCACSRAHSRAPPAGATHAGALQAGRDAACRPDLTACPRRRAPESGGAEAGRKSQRPCHAGRRGGPGGGPDMQASGRADGWRPDGAAGAACMRMEHDRPRILLTRILLTRILLTRMGRRSTYGSTCR